MAVINETIFSEYDVKTLNFIVASGGKKEVYPVKCIGKMEEASNVRTLVKKYGKKVMKNRTWGTGDGTLKLEAHMPYKLYTILHGMERADLADGVYAYGLDSKHPEVLVTGDVYDEDDFEKLKAWPCCVASTGPTRSVENGADEVALSSLEIGFSPDEKGIGMYEALAGDVTEEIKTGWLESFTSELVKAAPTV